MDKKLLLSLGAAFITGIAANAADSFECGQWTISIDPGKLNLSTEIITVPDSVRETVFV